MASNEVKEYYNKIAQDYDSSRFENTYGRFIERQERQFLEKQLKKDGRILNLGCGTGRFMEYCTDGADFSGEMLTIAHQNYPHYQYSLCDIAETPYADDSFDAIICFHVIMHLDPEKAIAILEEARRILKPGGQLIFDYPSKSRRKMTKYKAANWHGGNDYTQDEIQELIKEDWETPVWKGVLFLPIHRLPKWFRGIFYGLDQLLTGSRWKHHSSYLILSLKKK